MAERRPLVQGIKPTEINPEVAKRFIRGDFEALADKPAAEEGSKVIAAHPEKHEGGQAASQGEVARGSAGRVPLTIRCRSDFAAVLKRASLQRQLDGVFPHTLQDIFEEAVEPWLKNNGYLK